ncbi:Breast cancer metastasis-suppressor 1-like protein-A [Geodia barretti]|uniref:Breast cancer metastasis-suppressor 1-like protein-A n=1 Tax=Geodia barretti TaxID=519541 RepID=A0AA35WNK2_GEOBA|nr:Breast cancer metastasis-suppressor 1-like protein-A [Geodia barretti]
MPLKSSGRNGNHHTSLEAKTNGHGDEDSSNSDCDSSLCEHDEVESERRKVDCLDDMQFLEQQFSDLKELLFHEKVREIDERMKHISEEGAHEYLQPLKELEEARQRRTQTAELQCSCKLQNIQNKYDEEVASAEQNFQELIQVTKRKMVATIQEKIRRLHEEKIVAEFTKENGSRKRKRNSEFLLPDKRKKPVTVNDIQPVFIRVLCVA